MGRVRRGGAGRLFNRLSYAGPGKRPAPRAVAPALGRAEVSAGCSGVGVDGPGSGRPAGGFWRTRILPFFFSGLFLPRVWAKGIASRFFPLWSARPALGPGPVLIGRARFFVRPTAAAPGVGRRAERSGLNGNMVVPGRPVRRAFSGGGAAGVLGSPGPGAGGGPRDPFILMWEL